MLMATFFVQGCETEWDIIPISYEVSGHIKDTAGEGVGEIKVLFSGEHEGSTTTEEDGSWEALLEGEVTVRPTSDRYTFDPSYKVVTDETHNLDFTLLGNRFTLEIEIEEEEGEVEISPDQDDYEEDARVQLRALPNEGWSFLGWQGDVTSEENPLSLTMDEDKTITPLFTRVDRVRPEIHHKDLSSGQGTLHIEEYDSHDTLSIILFPMGDSKKTHLLERISIEHEDDSHVEPLTPSIDERDRGYLFLSRSLLREKELEAERNHLWASQQPPSLSRDQDPQLGSIQEFMIFLEGEYQEPISATLMDKGESYLLWVDESQPMATSMAQEIGQGFAEKIRPSSRDFFGGEPDAKTFSILKERERVNILLSPRLDTSGYFHPFDLYSREAFPQSNEGKIIYIHSTANEEDLPHRILSRLAHEYQSMLFFNERILTQQPLSLEDIWLQEGFSQVFTDKAGYGYKQSGSSTSLSRFIQAPYRTSLIHWEDEHANYGITYLFARYLVDQFGEEIVPAIFHSSEEIFTALENFTEMDFYTIFRDFALALLLHQREGIESSYRFEGVEFNLTTTLFPLGSSLEDLSMPGWGLYYMLIGPGHGSDLQIKVEGADPEGSFQMFLIHERDASAYSHE